MTEDDPVKCPRCGEVDTADARSLIEKVCPPLWFSKGATLYCCNVCSATWTVYPKTPSASI